MGHGVDVWAQARLSMGADALAQARVGPGLATLLSISYVLHDFIHTSLCMQHKQCMSTTVYRQHMHGSYILL